MSKVPSRRSELPCLLAGPANYQRRIVRSSPIRRTQLMQFQIGHSTPRCPSATSGTTRVPASTGGPDRCAECSRAADVGLRGAPPVYRPQPLTTQLKRALPAFGQAQLAMGLRLASPVRTSMPPVHFQVVQRAINLTVGTDDVVRLPGSGAAWRHRPPRTPLHSKVTELHMSCFRKWSERRSMARTGEPTHKT